MNVLLDTHVFLWSVMQPDRLSSKIRKLLEDPETGVVVSAASAWEIATKFRLGRLPEASAVVNEYAVAITGLGASTLAISNAHALLAGSFANAHRDPFDRMLAAQSVVERLPLVSKDRTLREFDVKLLW